MPMALRIQIAKFKFHQYLLSVYLPNLRLQDSVPPTLVNYCTCITMYMIDREFNKDVRDSPM